MDPFRRQDESPSNRAEFEAPLSGVSVLLVEDDALSREGMTLVLEHYGAEVQSAGSVADALRQLDDGLPPSVLVSDIGLPGENGLQLIRRIRSSEGASPRRLPAIALSGFADPELKTITQTAGFDHFLNKPVDIGALVSLIERLVAAQRTDV